MKLDDYIEKAVRTDTKVYENAVVNPQLLVNVLALFISSGDMLDQVKKHIFYGKPYDPDRFNVHYQRMVQILQHMVHTRINGTTEDMGEEEIVRVNHRILHAIIGIGTEAGELAEGLYNVLIGQDVDLVNLREENGDLNWYQAVFYDTMRELGYEGTWDDDLEKNIAKLKARYPDKFTKEKALNRDHDKEREILERAVGDNEDNENDE